VKASCGILLDSGMQLGGMCMRQGMERKLNKGKVDTTGNACLGYMSVACQVEQIEVEN
jgi:hypothetical protein